MNISCEGTIAAIATAPGAGAIGVIRLSGTKALDILKTIWRGKTDPGRFEAGRVYVGSVVDPVDSSALDSVLVFWMKGPHSYTGEDLVEIQAHGGRTILETLLEKLVQAGARLAHPGEFTRRAFLNGRLDLTQAEAVADLIAASSREAARLAESQLSGSLSQYVKKLKNDLTVLRAQMEAMIDFPEDEDLQGLHDDEIGERIGRVRGSIAGLLATYRQGHVFRDGVRVAIVGKPNVGKSSLLNALLGEDRAIVHPTPGTTRDLIEETILIDGLPVRFIDTAGLRQGAEPIEAEGIRRTRERISGADLVLAVFDSSRPWEVEDDDLLKTVSGKEVFRLYNKEDLPPSFDLKINGIKISAKEGTGIRELKQAIFSHFVRRETPAEVVLTNVRHKVALEKGLQMLEKVAESAHQKISLEFLASDLLIATHHLAEITGEITNDEVLGEIFSRFCLGK